MPEARLPFQHGSVLAVTAGATTAGAVLKRRAPPGVGEVGAALVSVVPALFTLRAGEVAQYHGVEHKAIAAYEQDTVQEGAEGRHVATGGAVPFSIGDAAKEHERCGSHLVAPMMASNVAGTLLLRRVLDRPGPLAGGAVALASTAIAVEVFGWAERHASSPLARAFRRPGFAIQRAIGTREPDARQLEVGRAALAEILRAEGMGSTPH